ncbi:MAG: nitrate reductase, partial [Ktedonobacteraceae bacterium]|nr:nitrate reductase [Ktedonobacteraceae bacterium]
MNNDTSTPGTHRPQRQGRPATPRRRIGKGIGIGLIAVVVVA